MKKKTNTNKRLRWAHNHEMKRKYRIKKIEEKEKVSTQNNNNNKKNFPGLKGSGDPQRLLMKKGLASEDISWEKKKDTTNKRLWWVRTHFWNEKIILGKWWVRTFFEDKNKRQSKKKDLVSEDIYWEKKSLLQTKDRGEWGHTFGMKKILWKWWVRTFFEDKNKMQSKKEGLVSEDIFWENKDFYKQKIVVSEDTLLG